MKFDLSDEQRLLQETIERFARGNGDAAHGHGRVSEVLRRKIWKDLAELGVLALPFAVDDGGFGGGPVESMIVADALGRELLQTPFTASIVLTASLLGGASRAQRSQIVSRIAEGVLLPAFAHQEPQARYDLSDVVTRVEPQAGGWILDGVKTGVVAGDIADLLIVSARLKGSRFDEAGIGLFLVDPRLDGVTCHRRTAEDGEGCADFIFSDVKLTGDAGIALDDGLAAIEQACDVALAAGCAEGVGVMQTMLALTIEHLKTRKQFGRKLGEFQALQHRAVEMLVSIEQARSMAIYAASMAEHPDSCERRKAVSAAKVLVGQALRFVGQQAVQLHGGIGVTEEHAVGRYFRRATVLGSFLGDCDHHLARFADTEGFIASMAM